MATLNDSGVPYGSSIITIGATGFVGENISCTEPSTIIEVRDELGAPSDQVIISGFKTATATVQYPTTTTAIPTIGAVAVFPPPGSITVATWYVSEVGGTVSQLDIKKSNLSFRVKLN